LVVVLLTTVATGKLAKLMMGEHWIFVCADSWEPR
jgi:hypothetical protein